MTRRPTLCTILVLAISITLGACVLDRGAAPNPRVSPATPVPTIAPTPRLVSTPLPPPTPAPVTRLGRAGAELLVWEQVRSCAEAVARSAKSKVDVEFAPTYEAESGKWLLEVSSQALGLSFGRWAVVDATGQVAADDRVAQGIATPDMLCQRPEAFVAGRLTPPLLIATGPATTPTPAPGGAAAELQVWAQVRRCAEDIARAIPTRVEVAFKSSSAAGSGTWLVEAFSDSPDLDFGRWQVDDATGGVTPVDQVAQGIASLSLVCVRPEAFLAGRLTPPIFAAPGAASGVIPAAQPGPAPLAAPAPTLAPLVATAEQARVRVWASVRPCFEPPPPIESFTAYQDRPRRWIVEGRARTTSGQTATLTSPATYGLWVVNADTGEIIPSDDEARRTVSEGCIRVP